MKRGDYPDDTNRTESLYLKRIGGKTKARIAVKADLDAMTTRDFFQSAISYKNALKDVGTSIQLIRSILTHAVVHVVTSPSL